MWVSNATCCLTQRVEVGDDFPMLGELDGENWETSARLAWIWVATTRGAREMDGRNPANSLNFVCCHINWLLDFFPFNNS